VKQKAFCGEGNRLWSECLRNAVRSLMRNGEDKFLNKLVNIHVLYLHCGRGFNFSQGRQMNRCLISYFLCGNSQNNFGPHKAWKNLGFEAVKWKTVAKVGVTPFGPTCLQMHNFSPCFCPNPLWFLIFGSDIADEPVAHMEPHSALRKTVALLG